MLLTSLRRHAHRILHLLGISQQCLQTIESQHITNQPLCILPNPASSTQVSLPITSQRQLSRTCLDPCATRVSERQPATSNRTHTGQPTPVRPYRPHDPSEAPNQSGPPPPSASPSYRDLWNVAHRPRRLGNPLCTAFDAWTVASHRTAYASRS
jgi:hypothetical protein